MSHYAPSPALNNDAQTALPPRAYAWVVFALTFGLLLSDYMSRQVLNAIFPLLKADWGLSDTALGSLTGVVALMVGVLTIPLSLLADRIGRVLSVTLMALLWSAATLACGLAQNFEQMLAARALVGLGEAAYGSVGLAILFSVFPASMRASMTGAFMAGGIFGSVIGVALGGFIAAQFGWRMSFTAMAGVGFALGVLYPIIVRTGVKQQPSSENRKASGGVWRNVFGRPVATITYVASGLQLFVVGAITAWMPSFFNRVYAMPTERAAAVAGGFILIGGIGMIVCGMIADRAARESAARKLTIAAIFCAITFLALSAAFLTASGPLQMALLGLGMFFAAGSTGPAGAVAVDGADPRLHGTVLATLTLANNLLGLAPGPIVTGMIADQFGLANALKAAPFMALAACLVFWAARRRCGGAAAANAAASSHGLTST